jgi:flagellar protein FliO/FliZ
MRELLVPIFGTVGAFVVQFVVTVVIVLGLLALLWWFVRRYSGVHFGGIGRGRVPRLAVVDMIAVDGRRKLVLVRRDTVEHLLLVGGPSDVLVEAAIQRSRQRSPQQTAQAAAARAALQPTPEQIAAAQAEAPPAENGAVEGRPANEPIPFPVGRSTPPQGFAARPQLRPVQSPAPEPDIVEPAEPQPPVAPVEAPRPARLQPMRGRPMATPPPAATVEEVRKPLRPADPHPPAMEALLPEVESPVSEPPPPPEEEAMPASFAEAERLAAEEARQSALDLGDVESHAPAEAEQPEIAPAALAQEEQPTGSNAAARVSDLEREMARLLDEITARRSS